MANKRHKPGAIVTKLRQVDMLVGQGMARVDAIREVQITEQTYYRWRKQYGGMGTDQLTELNRPGFAGGSHFQVGWSHDEQNDEQVFP